jgi:LysM repeat protein
MSELVCPYLGLIDDPETYTTFPSSRNHCQCARPSAAIQLDQQSSFCLTGNHVACPVYIKAVAQPAGAPANGGLQWRAGVLTAGITLLIILAVAIVVGIRQRGLSSNAAASNWTPVVAHVPLATTPFLAVPSRMATEASPLGEQATQLPRPTLTATATATSTATATATATPKPPTPTLSPQPTLACPPPQGWVAYEVQPNDNLFRLGLAYGVTVRDLQAANCLGDSVMIEIGQTLYVPGTLATPRP